MRFRFRLTSSLWLLVTLLAVLLAPGCTAPLEADPRSRGQAGPGGSPRAESPTPRSQPSSLFRAEQFDREVPTISNPTPDAALSRESNHFTQGLMIHQGRLLESTGGYGTSELLERDPDSAEIIRRRPLESSYFGEGLAARGQRLYQLTWTNGVCLLYDSESLEPQGSLFYPGEGWGLTYHQEQDLLVMSDGSAVLRFLAPESFASRRRLTVRDTQGRPLPYLNELEWVRGEIWANLWTASRIARISPEDGRLLGWIDLSELTEQHRRGEEEVLNGVAYCPSQDRLYVTGKLWPTIYRFDRVGERFFQEAQP